MSKSLGNIITLSDIAQKGMSIMAFKLLVLSKNYQTEGNFTWDNLEAAGNRLNHWYDYACLRHQIHDSLDADSSRATGDDGLSFFAAKHTLAESLRDNIDTARAVSVIDEAFSQIDHTPLKKIHRRSFVEFLQTIDELLGLDLIARTPDISDELKMLVMSRSRSRDAKDWSASDKARDELLVSNITVRDTPEGTTWTRTVY